MKTVIFTLMMAFIAFGAFGTTSAYAHCGICEASMKEYEAKKPCAKKCPKTGKTCECAKKEGKICEKSMKKKKPCEKSAGMKKPCSKNGYKPMKDHSEKGSLTIRSGIPETGRYN